MYKNNSRDSSKYKSCSPLKLSCNLTEKYHVVGYYSYTNRQTAQKLTFFFNSFPFINVGFSVS
jgi:hypothetical protein